MREKRCGVMIVQELTSCIYIPWEFSAFNSLVSKAMPVTKAGAPALTHKRKTLLSVLKQAQAINVKVVGQQRKTIIWLDIGLHMPSTSYRWLLMISASSYSVQESCTSWWHSWKRIQNSSIHMGWIESDIYGPSTMKQILEDNHVKWAKTAHLVTLQLLIITLFLISAIVIWSYSNLRLLYEWFTRLMLQINSILVVFNLRVKYETFIIVLLYCINLIIFEFAISLRVI